MTRDFHLDFFRASIQTAMPSSKNLVVCPLSIRLALGLLCLGAKGSTADVIARTLGFETPDAVSGGLTASRLTSGTDTLELAIANGLFLTADEPVNPQFYSQAQKYYDAEISVAHDIDAVNSWAHRKTNGQINRLMECLDKDSLLVIANAVAFRGRWEKTYDRSRNTFQSPKRCLEHEFAVARNPTEFFVEITASTGRIQVLKKSYSNAKAGKDPEFAMHLVLPPLEMSIEEFVSEVFCSSQFWRDVDLGLREQRLEEVRFPIVEIDSSLDLRGPLSRMTSSLADLFECADFSGISERAKAISQAGHRVSLSIDENGTTAYAATAIEIVTRSLALPAPSFVADRPFLFALREDGTGEFLFMGVISNPGQKSPR